MTDIVRDEHPSHDAMAIVEKYETFMNYLYPKVQNCPRRHGVLRDQVLAAILGPVPAFYAAGKSRQVSRLYQLDAELAALRFWLRFMVHDSRRVISRQQEKTALAHLNEVGRMLGAWIKKLAGPKAVGESRSAWAGARPDGRSVGSNEHTESAASARPMGQAGK